MKKRILITGGGGAAAVSFVQTVASGDYDLFVGDIDPYAAGLYRVPPSRRMLLPRGDAAGFARRLLEICLERRIDVLVPTVDAELLPLASKRAVFRAAGVELLLADAETLGTCLDKHRLVEALSGVVRVPRSALLDESFRPEDWGYPVIAKPRTGSGSRGVERIDRPGDLDRFSRDGSLLVQEYLPGAEYSVDVLALPEASLFAAVPRERLKVDSGVAVAGRTVRDAELEVAAEKVAGRIGLDYVANVQFRRDRLGRPALLEVNPRFPGTMPLTVAAGIDMPGLALAAVLGEELPSELPEFREIAMVRTWEETYVRPVDVAALELACA